MKKSNFPILVGCLSVLLTQGYAGMNLVDDATNMVDSTTDSIIEAADSNISNLHPKFDFWDTFRGDTDGDGIIDDKNISTKITNQEINVTIASLNEDGTQYKNFTGTVCSRIGTDSEFFGIGGWKKNYFNDENKSYQTFTVSKAIKDARVKFFYYPESNATCPPAAPEIFYQSTDNFAIRPKKFKILPITTPVYAGNDFNISFEALDENDTNTTKYDESKDDSFEVTATEVKPGCITGDFNLSDFSFSDGSAADINATYSEVGTIDINISDKNIVCGSRFAGVDCDDRNVTDYWNSDTNTSIDDGNTTVVVLPHHFKIDANLTNAYPSEGNFTYLSYISFPTHNSKELEKFNMSAMLNFNITAQNKQNKTTKNYNKECYAKDTNVTISYDTIDNTLTKILYHDDNDTNASDINSTALNDAIVLEKNSTIFSTDHNGSSANIKLKINFDRSKSAAVNPFSLHINELKVTDANSSSGSTEVDTNATFYYGRVHAPRQSIIGNEGNISIYYEVYCSGSGCNKALLQDGNNSQTTDDPRWFINTNHTTIYGNAGNIVQKSTPTHVLQTHASTGAANDYVSLSYDGRRGYPYKTTMKTTNSSEWLIYNKYNSNATNNESEVEFLKTNHGWTGKHETNTTTDTNASNKTNKRLAW
ncbi:hypothetical protein MNB_SM-5-1410 [hydrothermal vent metagenome]|uniref:Uncharacterized protein n=1 Tax=hydrothermal vent metagenome TaxID=652676 RepID=A0A1W1C5X5_9ZZZZ